MLAGLALPQAVIAAFACQQLLMCALLGDAAIFQHNDLIGICHGGQAMGNHQHGAPFGCAFQRALYLALGFGVEGAGGLVEQQQRRVFQQGARNAHALFFPARQFQPPLAHRRVIAFGQRQNEIVDLRGFGCRHHLGLGGIVAPIGDVIADRVVKEHGILGHNANGAMQAMQGDIAHILPIDAQGTRIDVVKPKQQPPNRGFARA